MADSLEKVYAQGHYDKSDRLSILNDLAINHGNADKKFLYSELLIAAAKSVDSASYVFQGYLEKGNALRLKGDLSHALESYFEGAKIIDTVRMRHRLGAAYIAIADVYAIMGNHNNAVRYHQRAIRILREEKDSINIASALLNAGDEYITINELDTALQYTSEAQQIFQKINASMGQAYALGNLGMIYAKMGEKLKAAESMNQAIKLLEQLHEYYPIAVYLNYIADIYYEQGDYASALKFGEQSLTLAKRYGLKQQAMEAYLKLSHVHEELGNMEDALDHHKNYVLYKDSVNNLSTVQRMADLQTEFEVSKKQIEVDLLSQQKRNQQIVVVATIIAFVLISLLAFGLYRRYLYIEKTNAIISKERNRSDNLLLNILPKDTANELKMYGKVKAKKYKSVTVLFTDFVGFTNFSETMTPEKLVQQVDFYFSKFDAIIERYGMEKIKTIGDAYMCAAGLPDATDDHAIKAITAAADMVRFVNENKSNEGNQAFEIRVGINSGPVIAGVVGTQKFAYDIWGDTVNIAARMETNSEPGKINISENTYELVKHKFNCSFRGEVEVKNKGVMKMYYVEESVPVASTQA